MATKPPRLFRKEKAEFFPRQDIVAVLDGPKNIVHFNETYSGVKALETRALFMDEQVFDLPARYFTK